MSNKDLTLKQQLFIEAYLGAARGNGVEAARIAGYKGSDKQLSVVAARNIAKASIATRVRARVERVAASADQVLRELSRIALRDDQEFVQVRKDGRGEVVAARIVLGEKIRALELLGKYHGLFKELAQNPRDAARAALAALVREYPELDEEEARRIVAETYAVAASELVN